MPDPEYSFQPLFINHDKKYNNDRKAEQERKSVVLMVPQKRSTKGKQNSSGKSSDRADGQKFFCAEMAEPKDIA